MLELSLSCRRQSDALLTPHPLYQGWGRTATERQKAYRELFRHHDSGKTLKGIREATNKPKILGIKRFKGG